jgi:chaperonin GroEL
MEGAGSVPGLLVITETRIAELPKRDAGMIAMPGGGMGGMDF